MKTQLLRLNGELSGRNGILKRSVLAQQDCGCLRAPADISGPRSMLAIMRKPPLLLSKIQS
jgi:hypothetical protein